MEPVPISRARIGRDGLGLGYCALGDLWCCGGEIAIEKKKKKKKEKKKRAEYSDADSRCVESGDGTRPMAGAKFQVCL